MNNINLLDLTLKPSGLLHERITMTRLQHSHHTEHTGNTGDAIAQRDRGGLSDTGALGGGRAGTGRGRGGSTSVGSGGSSHGGGADLAVGASESSQLGDLAPAGGGTVASIRRPAASVGGDGGSPRLGVGGDVASLGSDRAGLSTAGGASLRGDGGGRVDNIRGKVLAVVGGSLSDSLSGRDDVANGVSGVVLGIGSSQGRGEEERCAQDGETHCDGDLIGR
ncbi:hypothetical protein BDV59DRAFT_185738 [Aspergillus ambiguus]|uniref:uncharacterized protein n=1 Tax=Aspergillus ambiguus TaxID=176160 RepID=UPI003CCCFB6C